MMSEEAFIKFVQGRQSEVTRSEAERFFRIDDYVTGKARAAKIERFKIMVAGNKALSQALDFLSGIVREN